jgi:hypothetical protein
MSNAPINFIYCKMACFGIFLIQTQKRQVRFSQVSDYDLVQRHQSTSIVLQLTNT